MCRQFIVLACRQHIRVKPGCSTAKTENLGIKTNLGLYSTTLLKTTLLKTRLHRYWCRMLEYHHQCRCLKNFDSV